MSPTGEPPDPGVRRLRAPGAVEQPAPALLAVPRQGQVPLLFYVGELGPQLPVNIAAPNLGPRISVLDMQGKALSRFGTLGGEAGQFWSPHGHRGEFVRRPFCPARSLHRLAALPRWRPATARGRALPAEIPPRDVRARRCEAAADDLSRRPARPHRRHLPRLLSRARRRHRRAARRRGGAAPRLGLGQRGAAHPVHAALAVPHVLDHQAVHLRRRAGCLPRPDRRSTPTSCPAAAAGAAGARCRCTCATTSPACATTGRWRCCMARRPRRPSATPKPPASSPARARCISRPGTRYSYVNQNFRLLSEIAAGAHAKRFAELLRTRISTAPAWSTALLAADTRAHAGRHARATKAPPPPASAPRRTASSGPAMPGSAPVSTT